MPEFRTPVMTLVEASWKDPSGAMQTIAARMEDKSSGGACIRAKTPIGVGARLSIQWRFEQFSGTARYCRSEGKEFLIGIQRDSMGSSLPKVAVPADIPLPAAVRNNPPVPTVAIESPQQRQASKPSEIPRAERKVESSPIVLAAALIALPVPKTAPDKTAPDKTAPEMNSRDGPGGQPADLKALGPAKLQIQQPAIEKRSDPERKSMRRKWLELPWRNENEKEQDGLGVTGPENGEASGGRISHGKSQKENPMPHPTQSAENASLHGAREVPNFQVELLPMEDIYCAAGIMNARRGYSINKVVEMINGEHIGGLSKEMKRVALLMALDAAGVPVDEVLQDARARQDALDSYEAQQRKQIEAGWARKAEENIQIQSELDSIKAHYMARISRNLEGIAREKATFDDWVALKRQECQSMAEAAELCSKSTASRPENASHPNVSPGARAAPAGANQA